MHKVMIVDDSNIIRNRIERCFSGSDFTVTAVARNGLDAVRLFEEHRPDLITMDLTMPEMDGLECIQQICAKDNSARILVVSALSDKFTGLQALEYGARGFLCKPFTDEDLVNAMQGVIDQED